MDNVSRQLRLTEEQKNLFFTAVQTGKRKMMEIKQLMPKTTTETYSPKLQYDMVNTEVEDMVKLNPHLQLVITKKKAAFHPYITVHDQVRNVFILVLKLPRNKYIFPESRYRGDYAVYNFDRLFSNGASLEDLAPEGISYQQSILFENDVLPYSIIVGYDGVSDYIFEGALRPDQSDWIYKDDLTDLNPLVMDNVIPFAVYKPFDGNTDARPEIRHEAFEEILVKLKDTTKDS